MVISMDISESVRVIMGECEEEYEYLGECMGISIGLVWGYVGGREWGECGVCMRERVGRMWVCMRERVGRVWGMYEGECGESVGYV